MRPLYFITSAIKSVLWDTLLIRSIKPICRILLRRSPLPDGWEELSKRESNFILLTQSRIFLNQILIDYWNRRTKSDRKIKWCAFYDHERLLKLLIEDRSNEIITLSIFERRGPLTSPPGYRLSAFRWIEILFTSSKTVFKLGEVRSIQDLKPESYISDRRLLRRIERLAKFDFYRSLKVVRGTPFQTIDAQEASVLAEHEIEREITLIANRERRSKEEVYRALRREFRALAAQPVRPLYSIGNRVCRFLIWKLFSGLTIKGLDRFLAVAHSHSTVLVPMHRSHLDYIIVGSALYESKINPPVVAAGVNLRFWPIGWVIRSLGAYFVKRDARSDRIHALVLKRYVSYLVKRGHLQEFFIEGGRSRSGRMRSPKLGLLNMMVDTVRKGARKDLYFIPVAITYERVVEDRSLGDENTGIKKKSESFLQLIKARRLLSKSYGDVVLSFGAPISLSHFLTSADQNISDSRNVVRDLASKLTVEIRNQIHLSLTSLACLTLMASPSYGLKREELIKSIKQLATTIELLSTHCGFPTFKTPTLERFLEGQESKIDYLGETSVVKREVALTQEVYFIPGTRRFTADFYKNATLHQVLPLAVFSLLDLMYGSIKLEDALPYYNIFRSNLILPDWKIGYEAWAEILTCLKNKGVLISKDGTDLRFSDRKESCYLPLLLLAPCESMLWCYETAKSLTSTEQQGNSIRVNELINHAIQSSRAGRALGFLSRTEATSHSSLIDAIETLTYSGVFESQDGDGSSRTIAVRDRDSEVIALLRRTKIALSSLAVSDRA